MKCGDCGNTRPALEGFPNHVLCAYYRLHMSNIADASKCEHFKPRIVTNADRIRSMTDEELAEWFTDKEIKAYERCGYDGDRERFEKQWLDWLKQEAE